MEDEGMTVLLTLQDAITDLKDDTTKKSKEEQDESQKFFEFM